MKSKPRTTILKHGVFFEVAILIYPYISSSKKWSFARCGAKVWEKAIYPIFP